MLGLQIIKAELRRNIRNKRILIMLIAFLCFFSFVFISAKNTMETKKYEEKLDIPFVYNPTFLKASELEMQMQYTPADQEPPGLRDEYNLWMSLYKNYQTWVYEHTQESMYGWKSPTKAIYQFNKAILNGMNNGVYKGDLDSQGFTKQQVKANASYYKFFIDHNVRPYVNDYEPNFANFIALLFRANHFIILLILFCIFTLQLITADFDAQTYKIQYSSSVSRNQFMLAKISASLLLCTIAFIAAFALFSVVPITQYGFGSFTYIYQIQTLLSTYASAIPLAILIAITTIILYLSICYLITLFANQFASSLIGLGSIMVIVYFILRLLETTKLIAYIPLFYIQPFEIAMHQFHINPFVCVCISVVTTILIFIVCAQIIKRKDLKGSDLS